MYSSTNIARVKRDEALAAKAEAEAERRADEIDAAQRVQILRREGKEQTWDSLVRDLKDVVHDKDSEAKAELVTHCKRKDLERRTECERKKRTRRRHGEDDTDRDIRVALEEGRKRSERRVLLINGDDKFNNKYLGSHEDRNRKKEGGEVIDLFGAEGHIALFPELVSKDHSTDRKGNDRTNAQKNLQSNRGVVTIFKENHNGNKDVADNANTTRLMDAITDRHGAVVAPWYSKNNTHVLHSNTVGGKRSADTRIKYHYPVENNDLRQKIQEDAVVTDKAKTLNDPLAVMQRAQSQIKKVEKIKPSVERGKEKDYCYTRMKNKRREEPKGQVELGRVIGRKWEREKGRMYKT